MPLFQEQRHHDIYFCCRYETTIFVITSGIAKLSKVATVAPKQLLYRGLNSDVILPDHFWTAPRQPRLDFIVHAGGASEAKRAADSVRTLITRARRASNSFSGEIEGTPTGMNNRDLNSIFQLPVSDNKRELRHGSPSTSTGVPMNNVRMISMPRVIGENVRFAIELLSERPGRSDVKATCDSLLQAVRECCADAILTDGRGAGQIPEVTVHELPADFRGGVEFGLLSLTKDRATAISYGQLSGQKQTSRGTLFEVQVGRIDIGASVAFLSQYPTENEYLLPPLSCLEVVDEPRSELLEGGGEIIVVPLRVNANLKSLTVNDLVTSRKRLHAAASINLREELTRSMEEAAEALNRTLEERRRGCAEQLRGSTEHVKLNFAEEGECLPTAEFSGRRWATLYAPLLTLSEGKVYFEVTVISAEPRSTLAVGFAGQQFRKGKKGEMGDDDASWGVYSSGYWRHANCAKKHDSGHHWLIAGAVIGIAVDLDTGTLLASVRKLRSASDYESDKQSAVSTWKCVCTSGVRPGLKVGGGLFPVLAGGWGINIKYNFGKKAMVHTPPGEGFLPVWQRKVQLIREQKAIDSTAMEMFDELGIGRKGHLAEFDLVRNKHEARRAEDYNDDSVYKDSLNEILEIKGCMERKRTAIIEMLEVCATTKQIMVMRDAPSLDFLSVKRLDEECSDYTWSLLFSGWLRFVDEVYIPVECPPCINALVWRAALECCASTLNNTPRKPIFRAVRAGVKGELRIELEKLLPNLHLRSAGLHARHFENGVVGFLLATIQYNQDIGNYCAEKANILEMADFRGLEFSSGKVLDLARAVVAGRPNHVNELVVEAPLVRKQNLLECIKRLGEQQIPAGEPASCRKEDDLVTREKLGGLLDPVEWGFVTAKAACHSWTVLNVRDNELKCLDIKGIATGLGAFTTLTDLDISCNCVKSEGATALGNVLFKLKSLLRLAMGNNCIQKGRRCCNCSWSDVPRSA